MNKWLLYGALFLGIVKSAPKTDDANYTACADEDFTYGCDYIGSSAKFRYYKCDSEDGKDTLTTTLEELAEYTLNEDGSLNKRQNVNKVVQFTSADWAWNTEVDENYTITVYNEDGNATSKSVKALCNTYDGELSVDGTPVLFQFSSCLLSDRVEIELPNLDENEENDYLIVEANSLKWSCVIGDYPWVDEVNDKLVLTVSYQTSGDANSTFTGGNGDNDDEYAGELGNFDFSAPLYGYVKDTNGNVTDLNVSVVCTEQGKNTVTCQFVFDPYDGTLYYDPTISGSESTNNAMFNSYSIALLISAILFVFNF